MAFVTSSKQINIEDSSFYASGNSQENFVVCKSPDKLKSLLSSLNKNHDTHYISDGDWSLHDLISELLKEYKPAELFLTTYAIREFSIRQLVMAMERKDLLSVNLLLDYRAKVRTPEVYQLASMNLNKICLMAIHAKITVIRSAKGCVSIVGSTNLTSNPRVEAGVISLNEKVSEFYIDNITKLMDNAEIFE